MFAGPVSSCCLACEPGNCTVLESLDVQMVNGLLFNRKVVNHQNSSLIMSLPVDFFCSLTSDVEARRLSAVADRDFECLHW